MGDEHSPHREEIFSFLLSAVREKGKKRKENTIKDKIAEK